MVQGSRRRPTTPIPPLDGEAWWELELNPRTRDAQERRENLIKTMIMSAIWACGILLLWAVL